MNEKVSGYVEGWWIYRYVDATADRTRPYLVTLTVNAETARAFHVTSVEVHNQLGNRPVDAWIPRSIISMQSIT